MSALYWVVIVAGALVGGLTTLYITLAMPAIIVWKIYRKVKYKISLLN